MRTNTGTYEFAHGRKPRGRGNWHFEITFTDGYGSYCTETRNAFGSLPEARAAAVRQLKAECGSCRLITEVEVLP